MTKRNLLILTVAFTLLMGIFGSAQAATYYVRTDGGTSAQCTGLADAAYPGTGTNVACAFNHPFWGISVAGAPMKMVGGDTMIIGNVWDGLHHRVPRAKLLFLLHPRDAFAMLHLRAHIVTHMAIHHKNFFGIERPYRINYMLQQGFTR